MKKANKSPLSLMPLKSFFRDCVEVGIDEVGR